MGMFDYIKCEYPLPDPGANEIDFQTKDTDEQYMERYTITKEGRLVFHFAETEMTPKAERPYPDADQNYHGMLSFYGRTANGEFVEYEATFTDGTLVGVRRVEA